MSVVVVMDNEELKQWQKEVRAKKAEEFGEIGLKMNCQHYGSCGRFNGCRILTDCFCETEVCQFYKKKV